MSIKPFLFCLALVTFLAHGSVRAAPASAAPTGTYGTFEYARTLFRQHRWAEAFGRFAALADRGHPKAAQIALFMVHHGPQLFNSSWDVSQIQIEKWRRVGSGMSETFLPDGAD